MKNFLGFITLISIVLTSYSITFSNEKVDVNYMNMGSHFIENKGQWPDNVKYLAVSGNYRTWITDKSLVFDVPIKFDLETKVQTNEATYLDLIDAKINKIQAFNKKELILNYFIGNKEITGVRVFDSLYVTNIFNNIDLNLRFDEGQLRYDFIVNEGANPNQIQMNVSENCKVINDGENLIFETENSIIKNAELKTFQKNGATINEIQSNFSVEGDIISFSIENYDRTKKLIIDPIVLIDYKELNSTPFPGVSEVFDIETQEFGIKKTIFVGHSTSAFFPVTFGSHNGAYDGIFGEMEVDNMGNLTTPWITFFGGASSDIITSVDVEKNQIYFVGETNSSNLPVNPLVSYYDKVMGGTYGPKSNFFSVFSLNGQINKYTTYLRNYHSQADIPRVNIEVSNVGIVYISGLTGTDYSPDSTFYEYKEITSQIPRAQNPDYSFIMSFEEVQYSNPMAFNLRFSSLFGGDDATYINDIDIDKNDNIYICGETYSEENSFNTTIGAYNTLNTSNEYMTFFSKLHFNGTNLVIDYNSYFNKNGAGQYGGTFDAEKENVNALVFAEGKLFIAGTNSIGNIPVLNAFDNTHNGVGKMEAYISAFQLNGNGTNDLVYSSYFGNNTSSTRPQVVSVITDLDYKDICSSVLFCGIAFEELVGFKGILNSNSLFDGKDAIVGAIDINRFEEYTLTELAYFNNNYSYSKALAIDGGVAETAINQINFGGFTGNYPGADLLVGSYRISDCAKPTPCNCDYYIKNFSFTFDLTKGGGTCSTDECYLENFFQMPINTPLCYTHITYSAELNGVVTQSPTTLPIVNNTVDLSQFNRCIREGQEYKITIKLLEGLEDESPCEFTQIAYCPIADDRSYCVPDCEDDEFQKRTNITIPLPACPQCKLSISYSTRIACNGNYDIRIDGLELINNNPADAYGCSLCGFSTLYELAIDEIILKNEMGFEPKSKKDPCSTIYRVIEASCWTDVSTFTFGGPTFEDPISAIQSFIPCESNCCGISLTVCRVDDDKVHITNNGPIYFDEIDCEGVYENIEFQHYDPFTGQSYPSGMSVPCEPRCEEFVAYTGGLVIAQLKAVNENKGTNDYLNKETLNISAKSNYSNNKITVNYLANLEKTSIIELYTIEGNILKSIKVSPSPTNQSIEIDCNDLNNGVYFINVKVSGLTIHENKIIKVK
ncbi:MAG: T9SS type A sorting domain-containing protein [Romboutsia sp.]|nr:T9SS type A sorting domain-containing protein [Romboutsia sp.]